MIRVGWLVDEPTHTGGAELTQAEFRAAAPADVEVVDVRPGEPPVGLDRVVIHNCMEYSLDDLKALEGLPIVKYWHDVGPWLPAEILDWLTANTLQVCCSPVQAEHMGVDAVCVPPALDLARFAKAALGVNGDRRGVVSAGSWRNYGKAPHKAAEWAGGNLDFYGDGPLAPSASRLVAYEEMPQLLAGYETFVFLPTVLEPFGRAVAEAWAAGCEVVTNWLVGARYWIEENPEALSTAGDDFWGLVLSA